MPNLFDPGSDLDQAFLLASHLPIGRVWEGGFDRNTNIGKLIFGLSGELLRLSILAEELTIEADITKTTQLLENWEKSIGIPNSYFSNTATIENRRKQVEQLFSNFGGVQKKEDLIRVAAFFGFTADITLKRESVLFPLTFPLEFSMGTKEIKHTIYVEILDAGGSGVFFPLTFPLQFSVGGATFLQLIFDILAPADVKVIFI